MALYLISLILARLEMQAQEKYSLRPKRSPKCTTSTKHTINLQTKNYKKRAVDTLACQINTKHVNKGVDDWNQIVFTVISPRRRDDIADVGK